MSSDRYKVGDHVQWSFRGGRTAGKIVKVHVADFEFMGRMRRCSKDKPQYEVESEQTGNHALHYGDALTAAKA